MIKEGRLEMKPPRSGNFTDYHTINSEIKLTSKT